MQRLPSSSLNTARLLIQFSFLAHLCLLPALLFAQSRPNILIAISDDQSYPHASAYGDPVVQTPAFDEVARRGTLFHNAFTPAPGCSPMRAAFLTGKYIWQIGAAGTHASHFPAELKTFPSELERAGYRIGYTGKPCGPGNFRISGRKENPAGPAFNQQKLKSPKAISSTDYAANFEAFLADQPLDEPFCFWFGGHEPHRSFDQGIGRRSGMNPSQVKVPAFLPDREQIRDDMLDYFYEIQWFDQHLHRMLRTLESQGKLENTLVIVTSDNGMSFPRAKANVYEYGIHMPLAICWPEQLPSGKDSHDVVNLIDVTATIYEAAQVSPPEDISGRSLMSLLQGLEHEEFSQTFSGRERHSSSRWNSLGYPQRCIRTKEFLYIRNFAPQRWPAGAPRKFRSVEYDPQGELLNSDLGPEHGGYHDIDACPTLDFLIQHRNESAVDRFLQLAVGLRPAEELYNIVQDPACLNNLATVEAQHATLQKLRDELASELIRTADLRVTDFAASHIWETYPRYSGLRWFPEPSWVSSSDIAIPPQPWLEDRRPGSEDNNARGN